MTKCTACGYIYKLDWLGGKKIILKGDEDFLSITIAGHTFSDGTESYLLVACPKCHTVKLAC